MATRRRTSGSSRTTRGSNVKVDLSKTKERVLTPEGRYSASIEEATVETNKAGDGEYIQFKFAISEGKYEGNKVITNCSLKPQALFSLKNLLSAIGFSIPKKAFDLDLNDLIGQECDIQISHEMYEGKRKPKITEFYSSEEEAEDEDVNTEDLLEELSLVELKQLAKALGVKASELKGLKKSAIIDLLLEEYEEEDITEEYDELFDEDTEDEEDEDTEDEEDEEEEDYSDMPTAELRTECRARGLSVKKGMKKQDLIDMLEEDDDE
jgi:hypothetical protein